MATFQSVETLLNDIVQWAERIERYVQGMDFQAFLHEQMAQDAVIRCLEVIGEASAQILKVAPDFQAEHPDLELRQASRARNRTAHGYGSISLESIWQSAVDSAPRIAQAAKRVLDERRK